MKINPVILCGGEGTRLWPNSKSKQPKQFIDFGGWTLFEKTLLRLKNKLYAPPIIITNKKYLNLIKKFLLKLKFKKWHIVLEPVKKNTNAAFATVACLPLPNDNPMIVFPSDHLIENVKKFNKSLRKNVKYLNDFEIFLFGIKPKTPSDQYGYFITRKKNSSVNKIIKFLEKPNIAKAKRIVKKKGYWNSGIVFAKQNALLNSFNKHDFKTLKCAFDSFEFGKKKIMGPVFSLNKKIFSKIKEKSFDYSILEKYKHINAIKLDIPWTDLGNWKEILKVFYINKLKLSKKKNTFFRPWGKYVNLFRGKRFLIKELTVNSKSSISLQKHYFRSEHWMVTQGKAKITINKRKFFKKENDSIFIPVQTVHRIENLFSKPVKIMEAQIGEVLKESDIVRYKDIYGRVK